MTRLSTSVDRATALLTNANLAADATVREPMLILSRFQRWGTRWCSSSVT